MIQLAAIRRAGVCGYAGLLLGLGMCVSQAGAAALSASELLLVYNQEDPRSRELAEYYAKVRSVPADRLCPVRAASRQEEVTRAAFDRNLRLPIRAFLDKHPESRRIRCIVLFYGLPIRVGPKIDTPADRQFARRCRESLESSLKQFGRLTAQLESLAGKPASRPEPPGGTADEAALGRAVERYRQAQLAAWQQVAPHAGTVEGQQQYRAILGVVQAAEGLNAVLARAEPNRQTPEIAAQLATAIEQARRDDDRLRDLRRRELTDPERAEALKLIQQNYGLIGLLRALWDDLQLTQTEQTTASVDSELTLVRWDHPPLYRWVGNRMSWQVRASAGPAGAQPPEQSSTPVMMVCRIDGPSAMAARRIVDDSLAVEKTGLTGIVYIDARGLPDDKGYGLYDEDLRKLAALLQQHTKLDVRLDNRPEVFAPGQCPNTMLYCGWYSVRKYVPAFQFVRGAIACHLASFEAVTIKTPGEQGWVRGLLADGADATFGPVAEPFLQAFPLPTKFFGLLLTGQFTLAECFAYTSELNSWMLLLIGDPLYRPFAVNPQLRLEQVYPADQIPLEFRTLSTSAPATSPG